MGIFEGVDDDVVEQLVLENEQLINEVRSLRKQMQGVLNSLNLAQHTPPETTGIEDPSQQSAPHDHSQRERDEAERARLDAAQRRSRSIEALCGIIAASRTTNASLLRGRLPSLTASCLEYAQQLKQLSTEVVSSSSSDASPLWLSWGRDVDGMTQCVELLTETIALVGAPPMGGGGSMGGVQRLAEAAQHRSSTGLSAPSRPQGPPMLWAPRSSLNENVPTTASTALGPSDTIPQHRRNALLVSGETSRVVLSGVHRTSTAPSPVPEAPQSRRRERSQTPTEVPPIAARNRTTATTLRRAAEDYPFDLPVPTPAPSLSAMAHELPDRQGTQPTPPPSRPGSMPHVPVPRHASSPPPQPVVQYLMDDEDMDDVTVHSPARMVSRTAAAKRGASHCMLEHSSHASMAGPTKPPAAASGVAPLGSSNIVNTPPMKKRRSDGPHNDMDRSLMDASLDMIAF